MKAGLYYLCLILLLVNISGGLYAAEPLSKQEEKKIRSLISKMSLEEKVSLLHGNSKFYVEAIPRLGIPELALSDGPHGVRAEINRDNWNYAGWTNDSSTYFPTGTALAASWNPELARLRGEVLGEEARYRGKDILLGPGVNIIRSPLCGRNFEYMSEDPYLVAQMTTAYIQGLQSRDVAACVKHYIANNQETDRATVDVNMSDRALHEIYLPAFKAAVQEAGTYSIMTAYNKFRGFWCAENPYLLDSLMRRELGFEGIFVSDWNGTHSTLSSAKAGLDLEMGTDKPYNEYYFAQPLIDAVRNGELPGSLIDQKVAGVLRLMMKLKIFDPTKRFVGSMNTPEHQQATYRSAAESIVLLKNENNILPLDPAHVKSLAVIGDNATRKQSFGGQSSEIKALYEVTPLEGLKNRAEAQFEIRFAQGYQKSRQASNKPDWELINEAAALAAQCDVAVVMAGLNHDYDTESRDKPDLVLPYGQLELIRAVSKANPKTIVVIIAGSAVDMAGFNYRVPGLLWAWYNGMEGGNALADVLLGKVNPSGKMPFSLPVCLDQSNAHALGEFPGRDQQVDYFDDIFVGYRWFDTYDIAPLYPFGHGLSYTRFEYSELSVDKEEWNMDEKLRLSMVLSNTGRCDGAEVVQLYVSDPESELPRPQKELKAFQKVFLKAGERRELVFELALSDLAYYNDSKKEWLLEPGAIKCLLGSSSREIRQEITIKVN
ncbi:MAG: glycoside hydrolase family 3 C-terminal domain-containing protein [Bacteroidales bacterium]|nr:glycoside hydrolase family 3 C-terminal domain-containing protein [Bacteroidales bacterium]